MRIVNFRCALWFIDVKITAPFLKMSAGNGSSLQVAEDVFGIGTFFKESFQTWI